MTRRRPIVSEPDQRYWRARANRRVRKARFARNALRWSGILLLNAAFMAGLAFMVVRGLDRLKRSGEFALERIELLGTARASTDSIRSALAPLTGSNLLDLDLKGVEQQVRRDPWVLQASVRRVLPRTLRVQVTEREPVALALIRGHPYVVDSTGYVVGPLGNGMAEDLPVLIGLEKMEGEKLAGALNDGARMIDRLQRASAPFAQGISELDLSRRDRVTARTLSAGPRILLDPERIERNVQSYLSLRGDMERRLGPIDYVDLRWEDRISVMPIIK